VALLRKEDVDVGGDSNGPEMGALLGRGSRFEGKLSFEGTVRIEGEFVGDIVSEGHLIVGESARIEATVSVGSALVSGSLSGTIATRGTLELKRSARVKGDLDVESLTMEKGAFFEGSVKMKPATQALAVRPAATADRRG
jgi:cytoskeletal protein CcmA (bactofilin family)